MEKGARTARERRGKAVAEREIERQRQRLRPDQTAKDNKPAPEILAVWQCIPISYSLFLSLSLLSFSLCLSSLPLLFRCVCTFMFI